MNLRLPVEVDLAIEVGGITTPGLPSRVCVVYLI